MDSSDDATLQQDQSFWAKQRHHLEAVLSEWLHPDQPSSFWLAFFIILRISFPSFELSYLEFCLDKFQDQEYFFYLQQKSQDVQMICFYKFFKGVSGHQMFLLSRSGHQRFWNDLNSYHLVDWCVEHLEMFLLFRPGFQRFWNDLNSYHLVDWCVELFPLIKATACSD